ncbi:MAG: hypothetical protein A3F84_21085 [Candidatus Handelsmanbacteria bacterium RIFCSPLOWO2_12_FULL_64_10]|uniref:Exonuclease domain-containing protein n=1 Tax=Handelsmanbacteria sp. (strain RIFCSPLOWO2_12_FULL_64_10) TaxID=1817868 RepID=A0A1F6CCR5_HANXR|nr:MAG: hypothetical protein A3F84_21085 [Candidatus Handelsmanbacteria bacterium RIFCSPLOWO2_12_FULL_64_10]
METEALEKMADALQGSGMYRVLKRFERPSRYAEEDDTPKKLALVVDIETTGKNPRHDAIIQFCGVPFEYSATTGQVYRVDEAVTFLEDPRRPIPPEITALTGLRDQDVAGKRIEDEVVRALLGDVALVIAHNAGFDRKFLERRLPAFKDRPWACSLAEAPWQGEGFSSAALEFLLYKKCGMFMDAHRADEDCHAVIHLLATPFASGQLPLKALLESARKKAVRIWAVDARFDFKEILKQRRYRWNSGEDGRPRAWYIEVPEGAAEEECGWLKDTVYGGRAGGWKTDSLDAYTRYSDRVNQPVACLSVA